MEPMTRRDYLKRNETLKVQRAPLLPVWRKITEYLLPYSGRYFQTTRLQKDASFASILDNTAGRMHQTLTSGLMESASSPARAWFELEVVGLGDAEDHEATLWREEVALREHAVMGGSNVYDTLERAYSEKGAFGTTAGIVEFDFDHVVHCYPLTIGTYCIAANWRGEIDTIYREFVSTVAAVVEQFGIENCSTQTKMAYERKDFDAEVQVLHVIEPRRDRDPTKRDNLNMAWRSCYMEISAGDDAGFLRESGYPFFPAYVSRWEVNGDDVWGVSPAMRALGDIRGLQQKQVRMAEVIDLQSRMPTQGPVAARDIDRLPGGHTKTDGATGRIEPLMQVPLSIRDLQENIIGGDYQRIAAAFFADVFRMFEGDQRSGITAREIAERHEEKMLMLGPVVLRINRELLKPLVEIVFHYMGQAGILPPIPESLHGRELQPRFISVLAQAQRSVGASGMLRLVDSTIQMAQAFPQALDRIDVDETIEGFATVFGAPAKQLVSREDAAMIRQARAQAQAAQAQAAMLQQQSIAAKNLATAPSGPGNVLNDTIDRLTGYGAQGPTAAAG